MTYNKLYTTVDREALTLDTPLILDQVKRTFCTQLIMININHLRRLNDHIGILTTPENEVEMFNKIELNVHKQQLPFPTVIQDPRNKDRLIFEIDVHKTLDTMLYYTFGIKEESKWK